MYSLKSSLAFLSQLSKQIYVRNTLKLFNSVLDRSVLFCFFFFLFYQWANKYRNRNRKPKSFIVNSSANKFNPYRDCSQMHNEDVWIINVFMRVAEYPDKSLSMLKRIFAFFSRWTASTNTHKIRLKLSFSRICCVHKKDWVLDAINK